ncbi:MAG: hypothetical protein M0C28_47295 [Candidatus Moduliflexus flocculans]|nr:hypothetical protein [Candidatus Moduliflexus flocculans]
MIGVIRDGIRKGAEQKRISLPHLQVSHRHVRWYSFFASAARKEGYEQTGAAFQQTSDEEREHARLFFKQLKGGRSGDYCCVSGRSDRHHAERTSGPLPTGEKMEWGTLYPGFAKTAER